MSRVEKKLVDTVLTLRDLLRKAERDIDERLDRAEQLLAEFNIIKKEST